MKTTIDRFGRIVVPKRMRKQFGLEPGVEVEIDERGNEIIIRQATEQPPLKNKDGVLVFAGKAAGDVAGWVRRVRENRHSKVSSGKS